MYLFYLRHIFLLWIQHPKKELETSVISTAPPPPPLAAMPPLAVSPSPPILGGQPTSPESSELLVPGAGHRNSPATSPSTALQTQDQEQQVVRTGLLAGAWAEALQLPLLGDVMTRPVSFLFLVLLASVVDDVLLRRIRGLVIRRILIRAQIQQGCLILWITSIYSTPIQHQHRPARPLDELYLVLFKLGFKIFINLVPGLLVGGLVYYACMRSCTAPLLWLLIR